MIFVICTYITCEVQALLQPPDGRRPARRAEAVKLRAVLQGVAVIIIIIIIICLVVVVVVVSLLLYVSSLS